jgi:polysaccharide biosynthesis/export protein
MEAGSVTQENVDPPFTLVEVGPQAISVLAHRGATSLRGRFGDYRPPASPVIGVGDNIIITVWEAASGGLFSASLQGAISSGSRAATLPDQTVGRDGSITVPYGGRIQAAGRTPQQVEAAIIERLRGKAIEPQVIVNVSKNASNIVTVTGEVTAGARVPLSLRGDRIMDVIATAGGFRASTHETFISLTRDNRTIRVPVQMLLADPRENIFVRPGDVITVERTPQTFTVAGATGANAMIPFDARGLTLEEALGKAGGLQDMRADPDGVFVMRYEPVDLVKQFPQASPELPRGGMAPVAYHLNMRDPSSLFLARKFAMRDKDIIFVSNAPLTELGKYFQLFQMLTAPVVQGAGVATVAKAL